MRAFIDTKVTHEQLIASLEAHAAADRIVQGRYWMDGKGCAVGCSLVDFGANPEDHAAYEPLFGIPRILARLEDGIFEGLPAAEAKTWPLRFANAVKPGADLSLVWPHFAVWLLVDKDHGVVKFANENGRLAIERVAALYARVVAGETVDKEEFRQAADAAYAYAAAYAAYAYAAAAYAAYAYADAAAYAAYAYAADAYAYAYADAAYAYERQSGVRAREDARRAQADKLIGLIEAAPVQN